MAQDAIIVELENALEKLEIAADQCTRGLLRIEEAKKIIEEADRKLKELLPPDSPAFRIYERSILECSLWWNVTRSGYVDEENCKNIEHRINIVQNVINEYEPEFLRGELGEKKQYFLSAGDVYLAKKLLLKTMKRANKSLAVVDPYLDEEIFDYIESLDISIDICLITGTPKPMFRQLYNALKTKRSNIEAKEYHLCHDRFLVLNGFEVWHLGASINGAGKKAFMISKVVDSDERNRLLSDFNAWWSNGTII